MDPVFLGAVVAAAGVTLGASITGAFTLWSNRAAKKSEERRMRQELAIRTGIEDYKSTVEIALKKGGFITPLGLYILNAAEIIDLVSDSSLSEPKKLERLRELDKRSRARVRVIEEEDAKS